MMSDYGNMWFGGGFMWIFWILLFVIIVWAVKASTGNSSDNKSNSEDGPIDILKKRYARGEIDEEEYKRRLKELETK